MLSEINASEAQRQFQQLQAMHTGTSLAPWI